MQAPSRFCEASRVPNKLNCNSPHMCSPPDWGSPGGNSTDTLLRGGAQKYALRTSTSATTFPPRLPVVISDSTTFSASSGGVDTYISGLACVLYSFATHLARTLGFPGCPLPLSSHPVLLDALPISRGHTFLVTLLYILWRRMYSSSSRLALAHSSRSSHPPVLSSQCHPTR